MDPTGPKEIWWVHHLTPKSQEIISAHLSYFMTLSSSYFLFLVLRVPRENQALQDSREPQELRWVQLTARPSAQPLTVVKI